MSALASLFTSKTSPILASIPTAKQPAPWRTALASGLLILGLNGCGGGAGAGGSGDTANNGTDSPPLSSGGQDPLPATNGFQTRMVAAADNAAAFIAQSNEQGQQGYRFRSAQVFGTAPRDVYITDVSTSATYVNKTLDPSSSASALVSQANTQGALGFRFRGNLSFAIGGGTEVAALYTSASDVTAVYTYEALTPEDSAAARQTQLKSQGARGFRFVSDFDFGSNGSRSVYARDTSRDVTYDYIVQSAATTSSSFLTIANLQGGIGFRFRSNIALVNGSEISSIFVSSSAGGTFTYSFLDSATSTEIEYLEQANAQGTEGKLGQSELLFGTTTQALYVDLSNCICQPLRLADPFTD